jgi:hypothetical protein
MRIGYFVAQMVIGIAIMSGASRALADDTEKGWSGNPNIGPITCNAITEDDCSTTSTGRLICTHQGWNCEWRGRTIFSQVPVRSQLCASISQPYGCTPFDGGTWCSYNSQYCHWTRSGRAPTP